MDPLREQALLARCRQNDPDALGELYDAYAARIYAFIYYKVHHRETAQDLLADTWLKVIQKIGSFDAGKGTFSGWLHVIARRTVIDHYRRLRPTDSLEDSWGLSGGPDPARDAEFAMKVADVREHLAALSPAEREVVIMRVWQEMSYAEIADALGRSEDACKVSFSRSVKRLRETMPLAALLAFLLQLN